MLKQSKNKIAIVRGLDVRLTQAEFAAQFKSFKPRFIGDLTEEIKRYLKKEKVDCVDLPVKKRYLIDPVKAFFGRRSHQSWLEFDPSALEKALEGIDIVEIYEPYFFYSAQTARFAKKKNIPLVTEIWTSFPAHPARFVPPYSFNVREVMDNTDLFILRSKKALSYLNPFNIPSDKQKVIYHGVNLKRFFPAAKQHGKKIKALFVGVLCESKGLGDLLGVFPQLLNEHQHLELMICGSGPMEDEVKKLSRKLPIKYFGQVSHADIPGLYRQADLFVGPSKEYSTLGIKRWEEFVGYTFMEALASGLPIVATRCGGIPEIVGDDNFLTAQGNKQQLFQAIDRLVEDKPKRVALGIQNRKRAEKLFDLFRQVQLTEAVIGNLFNIYYDDLQSS